MVSCQVMNIDDDTMANWNPSGSTVVNTALLAMTSGSNRAAMSNDQNLWMALGEVT